MLEDPSLEEVCVGCEEAEGEGLVVALGPGEEFVEGREVGFVEV